MKSLIFYAAFFFVALATNAHPVDYAINRPTSEFIINSIVMEDAIMMRVTASPSHGSVDKITVKSSNGQIVLVINGCGSTECKVDLSSLSSAMYNVHVNTSSGQSFSGFVMAGV